MIARVQPILVALACLIRHFSVRACVSEDDHELVKLEVEGIDNLRLGLGGLARLHKGARLSFLRRKVNGEVASRAFIAP